MERIDGYDTYKTASPEEYVDQDEIDVLERQLKPCPFCGGKAFFEESVIGWDVSCNCGGRIPGGDAQDVAAKWNTRPTPIARNVVRSVSREHWSGR